MAGPPPTHLPRDPAQDDLDAGMAPGDVVRRHPASPVAWLALGRWPQSTEADPLTVYAYARVGYHRTWTCCAATAGRARAPSRGSTSPTAASSAAWPCSPCPRRRSARPTSGSAARAFLRDSSPAAYDVLFEGNE